MERHLRIPHRPVKENTDIADRRHRKAHVRRDQNAYSNTVHQKKGEMQWTKFQAVHREETLQNFQSYCPEKLEEFIGKR